MGPVIDAYVRRLPSTFMQLRPLGGVARRKMGATLLSAFLCFAGPGSLIWSALQFANDIGNPTLVANLRVQISAKHEQRENPLYPETAEPPMKRVRAFVVAPRYWATGGKLVSEGGKPRLVRGRLKAVTADDWWIAGQPARAARNREVASREQAASSKS